VQFKNGDKFYFKVTNQADDLANNINWIVWDNVNKTTNLIPQA
jgi:hypothetical protein